MTLNPYLNGRRIAGILTALLVLVSSTPAAVAAGPAEAAEKSAAAWLALVDAGKYGESWDEASSIFKAAISRATWEGAVRGVRDPLGATKSRTLKSATYTKSLPGAPDGEYVVIQYDTEFVGKATALETITPMLDKDGKWRVSGYFIK